jgi:hypothetical protein
MKLYFILLLLDAATETKKGGFTPEEKAELKEALTDVQTALETKSKSLVEGELKKHADTINASIKKFGDTLSERDEVDKKNQEALDDMLVKFKEMQAEGSKPRMEAKSLTAAVLDALQQKENLEGLESVGRGHRFKMMLKGPIDLSAHCPELYDPNMRHKLDSGGFQTKDAMTSSGTITGDPVVTYGPRQALLPAQKVNFRDLIPTVRSETGTYVHYKETAATGTAPARTLENADKPEIEYHFTEVKTVTEYIAGIARFSKQLRKNLPWLQGTLPRLLQRDFFKAENRRFWDVVATAFAAGGGSAATDETDDVKQVMDWNTNLFDADFMASFGVMRFTALNRLNKLLYTNGYYQGSGGVLSRPDGSIVISGVPIIPVTWIPTKDKYLTFDRDYMERVEVESLALEFFEEDRDNVPKNLITARIECQEEINPMLPPSIVIGDFGNSSSS